jgi:alkanesulfonate monooxygenase SsuD/methylene tetrahydromethanopterin reductase-like flavin-dependent oxidoreductase (luciferase family)
VFKVPRAVWWDMIRAGLNPHRARNMQHSIAALKENDPTSLEDTPDEVPVVSLLKRMARNEEVSKEEAHEVLEPLDSVIIGTPDLCRAKAAKYSGIGTDRLLCLMQFGAIPHEAVMRSIRLAGEHLIPHFDAERVARAS